MLRQPTFPWRFFSSLPNMEPMEPKEAGKEEALLKKEVGEPVRKRRKAPGSPSDKIKQLVKDYTSDGGVQMTRHASTSASEEEAAP